MRATNTTISVPLKITYQINEGEAEKLSAEYADIPTDVVAKFIIQSFGMPLQNEEHMETGCVSV
jgi:hypothetical protein